MIKKKNIEFLMLIMLPVLPLLDMFIVKSFPLFSALGYLLISFNYGKKAKIRAGILPIIFFVFLIFSSSLITIVNGNYDTKLVYYLTSVITFSIISVLIAQRFDLYFRALKNMVFFYAFLNTIIYISRMIMYNYDFARVRGNVGIYGGNSAHIILLFTLLLLKKYKSKEYTSLLVYTIIHSIMYISKGAMLISITWLALDIINNHKTKILNTKFLVLGLALILGLKNILNRPFGEFIVLRFDLWLKGLENNVSILSTRADIFKYSIGYISENVYIILFGLGPTVFRLVNPWGYSNTHNLFLDIIMDTGIFSLLIFLYLIIMTLKYTTNKLYYLLCLTYAVFEGISLFFTTDIIVTGYAYMFFVLIYVESISKHKNYPPKYIASTDELSKEQKNAIGV